MVADLIDFVTYRRSQLFDYNIFISFFNIIRREPLYNYEHDLYYIAGSGRNFAFDSKFRYLNVISPENKSINRLKHYRQLAANTPNT